MITNQDLITVWSGTDGAALVNAAVYDAPSGRLVAVVADGADALASSSSTSLLSWDADAPEGSLSAIADSVSLSARAVGVVSGGVPDGRAFVVFEDGRAVPAATAAGAGAAPTSSTKGGGASSRRATVVLAVGGGGVVAVISAAPSKGKSLHVSLFGPDGAALVQDAAMPSPPSSSSTLAAAVLCGVHGAASATPLTLALAWSDGVLTLVSVGAGGLGAPRARRLPGFTAKPAAQAATAPAGGRKRPPPPAANGDTPGAAAADYMALADDGAGGVLVAYPTPAGLALLAVDGPLAAPRCAPTPTPAPPASRSAIAGLHLTVLASEEAAPHQHVLLLSGPGGAVVARLDTPPPGLASLIGSCPPQEAGSAAADADAAGAAAAAATLIRPAWADMAGAPCAAAGAAPGAAVGGGLATPLDAAALGGAAAPTGAAAAVAAAATAAARAVADLEATLTSRGGAAAASTTATAAPGPAVTAPADAWADAATLAPLPADVLGRGAAAAGALGAWASVKRGLAAQPLPSLAPAPGLVPAAAAAGEADLVAALLRVPDLPPEDAAALVEACLAGAWGAGGGGGSASAAKRRSSSLASWRARLDKTAAGAVTDAERAPPGPVRERATLRAAAAVAAVDASFAAAAGGSDAVYLLHGLVAGPRDEAALAAAAGRLSPSVAPALAAYLAAWARLLGAGPDATAAPAAAAAPALGCPPPPPLVVPTIADVAAWASALVDAHLVALAGAARGSGCGSSATAGALRDLHALACAEAADAAALAPLAGAAAHIAAAAPLPDLAVAAATVYSVELLDLGCN